nr:head decoration protein [uncultured Roseococcus sp.]
MVRSITERRHAGGFMVSEANGLRSRGSGVLVNTSAENAISVEAGLVLAQRRIGVATAEKVGGAGDGAITLASPAVGEKAQVGTYVLTCVAASTGAGTFSVEAPDGTLLANLTVGVAYAGDHINLTVADGGTDWGAGAIIDVTVPAGDGAYVPFTNAADLPAVAILWDGADLPAGGSAKCAVVERSAEVNADELVYDASLSGGALTAAMAAAATQLAGHGVIFR